MSASIFWLIIGVICIGLEAFGVTGIGLFFAGVGAFLVGIVIETGLIDASAYIAQFAWFFGATALTAAVLWKPMKQFRLSKKDSEYSNMVGERGTVFESPLVKGKEGKVLWSGAPMIAELIITSNVDHVAVGEAVIIKNVKGNKLFVDVA